MSLRLVRPVRESNRRYWLAVTGDFKLGRFSQHEGGPRGGQWAWSIYALYDQSFLKHGSGATLEEAKQALSSAWRDWLVRAHLVEVAEVGRRQRSTTPLPIVPAHEENRWKVMSGNVDMGYVETRHDLHRGEYWRWGFYKIPPRDGACWGTSRTRDEAAFQVTERFRDWLDVAALAERDG